LQLEEERYYSLGPISVENVGVKLALGRQKLYYIIKDKRFRPTPISTVQLVSEGGDILGEEIIAGKMPSHKKGERVFQLGRGFVIYVSRAREKGKTAKFVLPPVPFPEIEALGFAKNVVSASPTALGDIEIRKANNIKEDPKLASILIGFDIS
ncbi:MAG: hypothetical protein QXY98_00600, partial [Thermoplasmata archaeon]